MLELLREPALIGLAIDWLPFTFRRALRGALAAEVDCILKPPLSDCILGSFERHFVLCEKLPAECVEARHHLIGACRAMIPVEVHQAPDEVVEARDLGETGPCGAYRRQIMRLRIRMGSGDHFI